MCKSEIQENFLNFPETKKRPDIRYGPTLKKFIPAANPGIWRGPSALLGGEEGRYPHLELPSCLLLGHSSRLHFLQTLLRQQDNLLFPGGIKI